MGGAVAMGLVVVLLVAITLYLAGTLARSIQNERRVQMKLWKNFGLSLGFCSLFFLSWVGQAASEWQTFTDQQREHGQQPEIGDFLAEFSQSTLENWQSEFLQLFSFTVMAAVLIHKGSGESRDGGDRVEAALKRIENKLGTEPTLREPEGIRRGDSLHVVPDGFEGWALHQESKPEPEGYYDSQDEAMAAGRKLASERGADLFVHREDGRVHDEVG
jgi:Uncharacterized protein conserved in bacteria (DUF2188)